jgi:hypothetical protein
MTPSQAILLYLGFLAAGIVGGLLLAHMEAWAWEAVA